MRHPTNLLSRLALIAFTAWSTAASASIVNVTVSDASQWVGFINVYEPPCCSSGYVTGFVAPIGDLAATVANNVATMAPNTTQFPGKVIEANLYVDSGFGSSLSGQTLRFTGVALASNLDPNYVAYAFIREFSNNYGGMFYEELVPLVVGQTFALERQTSLDANNVYAVQYGFSLRGPNADSATLGTLGSISIGAVPEPATLALVLIGGAALAARSRRPI